MKTIVFFNSKGGIGKTSLAYHVSWMLRKLEHKVLSVDLDPQANLTRMFMDASDLEEVFDRKETLFYALEPLFKGTGGIKEIEAYEADFHLHLLPGDLNLSSMEGEFFDSWSKCLDKDERAFRVTSAFYRLIKKTGEALQADWAVIDMGSSLGAISRAVLIAGDYVIFPLGPDLFSHQGLKSAGKFLSKWREEWRERREKAAEMNLDFPLPEGRMQPAGYVVMKRPMRLDRPALPYQKWIDKMPEAYRKHVLGQSQPDLPAPEAEDEHLLAYLKDYRFLMPMALEVNKPMFLLRPGHGAIGSQFQAAQACYEDFESLTEKIIAACR